MTDGTSGTSTIRGIDIQKAAVGFAEEAIVLRKLFTVVSTTAREIRWYQKQSGFLVASTTSNGGAIAPIALMAAGALPNVVEQSWHRKTSYAKKFFVSSPLITTEDERDNDPDIFAGNLRDLTRAVLRQEDLRIYNILTDNQSAVDINSTASVAAWDASSGQDIIKDLLVAKRKIRQYGYNPEGGYLLINALQHQNLLTWIISTKGASIPSYSSSRVGDGVVQEILGLNVIVNEVVVADSCVVCSTEAVKIKEFVPLTTGIVEHIGIGREIRIWLESEVLLENPRACSLITNTDL